MMATEVGALTNQTDGTSVSATVTYDDVTRLISRVDWANDGPRDARVVIRATGKPTVETTCRTGRTGSRNITGSYSIDSTEVELRGY